MSQYESFKDELLRETNGDKGNVEFFMNTLPKESKFNKLSEEKIHKYRKLFDEFYGYTMEIIV